MHKAGDQFAFEPAETGARRSHCGQDGFGFGRTVHLGGGFDDAPHQVQFLQRLFAAGDIAHVRQEGFGRYRGRQHLYVPEKYCIIRGCVLYCICINVFIAI